jgi:hypothetical protein
MIPHKYPFLPGEKQIVAGVEIARLGKPGDEIPVVATTEVAQPSLGKNRITLFWWNPGKVNPNNPDGVPGWQSTSRDYQTRDWSPPYLDGTDRWNWSQRLALAASDPDVFLIYKRKLSLSSRMQMSLFIEHYAWDRATGALNPSSPEPVTLPFWNLGYCRTGFHLWASVSRSANKLLVLTQAVPKTDVNALPKLVLFSLNLALLSDPAKLQLPESWEKVELGEGGYDFDVYFDDPTLACIYRTSAWVFQMNLPELPAPGSHLEIPLTDPASYNPFNFVAFHVVTKTETGRMQGIPGGEHPQMQSLDPLLVTCDRYATGTLQLIREEIHYPITVRDEAGRLVTKDWSSVRTGIIPNVTGAEKTIMAYDPQSHVWRTGPLFPLNPRLLPRTDLILCLGQECVQLIVGADRQNSTLSYGTLLPLCPVYLAGMSRVHKPEGWGLDFLSHHESSGVLAVSRFLVTEQGNQLGVQLVSDPQIYDINHTQMADPAPLSPEAVSENIQFQPFSFSPSNPQLGGVERLVLARPTYTFDNTIGGALVAEKGNLPLRFFAYNDLGDGGCRVVFADTLPAPNPQPLTDLKNPAPGSVTGPGAGSDAWIELTQSGWGPCDLPVYPQDCGGENSPSIATSMECVCNFFVTYCHGEFRHGQLFPEQWEEIWKPLTDINAGARFFRVLDSMITIDNCRIQFLHNDQGQPQNLLFKFTEAGKHQGQYRFLPGDLRQQGLIDYRLPMVFQSEDIHLDSPWNKLFYLNKIVVKFFYGRSFTPGILTSDQRANNPLTGAPFDQPLETVRQTLVDNQSQILVRMLPAALAAKPIGNSSVTPESIEVDFGWKKIGFALMLASIGTIAAFLNWIGLAPLAESLLEATTSASAWIMGIGLATVLGILASIPYRVRGKIKEIITSQLPEFKNDVILRYAGEGLAEALAQRAISQAYRQNLIQSDVQADAPGRCRFRPQLWQMIFVTKDLCKILIRGD